MAMHATRLDESDRDPSDPGPTLLDWARLVVSAVGRRKALAAVIFLASACVCAAYYLSIEPRYRVEARILAQRNQAMPSAVRAVFEDQPTRSAWELMHRRESLIELARRANLAAAPVPARGGARDAAPGAGSGRATADDALDQTVKLLDKRLLVDTEDGTITVSVEWAVPEQAYEIVKGSVENFLEARHVQEITAIDEVISVLQGRAATLRSVLDVAIEEAYRRPARTPSPPSPPGRAPSEELVRLQSLVEARQRAIRDFEDLRLRRVADLQAQVDRALNTLSEAHPTVIGLRKDLEAASRSSPQLDALREDERSARKEYATQLAREGLSGVPSAHRAPAVVPVAPSLEDDPAVKQARTQYDLITARLNAAQVELDAARAAFKYRYNVIWPPQLPSEPVSPNPKMLAAALLACLLLSLGAAAAPDLWSGRIAQRWQLERALALPILGEIRRRP